MGLWWCVAQVLWSTGVANGQNSTDSAVIRIGLLDMHRSPLGTEPLAAFLAAVKVINESPEQMIGSANFSARVVVEPYVSTSIRLDDEYQVQGQRDVAKMAARRECFHGDSDGGGADLNASNESYPEDLLGGGEGLDVHAFISGGDTEVVARFAPIVEAAGKSIVGYAAQGDMLSDKVSLRRSLADPYIYICQSVCLCCLLPWLHSRPADKVAHIQSSHQQHQLRGHGICTSGGRARVVQSRGGLHRKQIRP